jgi:hypothetical protein
MSKACIALHPRWNQRTTSIQQQSGMQYLSENTTRRTAMFGSPCTRICATGDCICSQTEGYTEKSFNNGRQYRTASRLFGFAATSATFHSSRPFAISIHYFFSRSPHSVVYGFLFSRLNNVLRVGFCLEIYTTHDPERPILTNVVSPLCTRWQRYTASPGLAQPDDRFSGSCCRWIHEAMRALS